MNRGLNYEVERDESKSSLLANLEHSASARVHGLLVGLDAAWKAIGERRRLSEHHIVVLQENRPGIPPIRIQACAYMGNCDLTFCGLFVAWFCLLRATSLENASSC